MRLLTDEEIRRCLNKVYLTKKGMHQPFNRQSMFQGRAIAQASQTETLKAVGEWLTTHCTDHYKAEHAIQRWGCYQCIDAFIAKANEGKMPGEE